MKSTKYGCSIALKIRPSQRAAIEKVASENQISLGEAARQFLDEGMRVLGVEI